MRLAAACVLALLAALPIPVSADPPDSDIVHLATLYVHRFIDDFANVVAEERYTQESTRPRKKRTLRSNFLLVRYPGATRWYTFRDVLEVDGKPVHDGREERLERLFAEPPIDALRRAQAIAAAGARYNIKEIGTVNNPLLAMTFLQREYVDRFRFTPGGRERKLGPTVRSIRYEETRVPTLLTQEGNRDLPARGVIWVDEKTGRVVKTELRLGEQPINMRSSRMWLPPATITTTFGFDEALGIDVMVEMRDKYPGERDDVKGIATYGPFRRFRAGAGAQ